jgi:hypothetical protein
MNSDDTEPSAAWITISGGAKGLRDPIATLPHARLVPSSACLMPNESGQATVLSSSVAASIFAIADATTPSSTSLRMLTSISRRRDSASGT